MGHRCGFSKVVLYKAKQRAILIEVTQSSNPLQQQPIVAHPNKCCSQLEYYHPRIFPTM